MNNDSIYSTTYGPIQGLAAIRSTAKANRIYIHVFDWPDSSLKLSDVRVKILSARLIATRQSLNVTQTENKLKIDLPQQAPDPNVTTIGLVTL